MALSPLDRLGVGDSRVILQAIHPCGPGYAHRSQRRELHPELESAICSR